MYVLLLPVRVKSPVPNLYRLSRPTPLVILPLKTLLVPRKPTASVDDVEAMPLLMELVPPVCPA